MLKGCSLIRLYDFKNKDYKYEHVLYLIQKHFLSWIPVQNYKDIPHFTISPFKNLHPCRETVLET